VPARVAVGFTSGKRQPDGRYVVRGRDAHAWPEVYLAGYGWVAFEPTPGRGMPGAEDYTEVAPQGAEGDPTVPTTAAPPTTAQAPPDPAVPEELPEEEVATPEAAASDGRTSPLVWVLAIAVLAVLGIATVPVARAWRRRRRREAATTPAAQVLVAWQEAEEAMAAVGRGQRPWETAGEYASRVGQAPGGTALARLADDTAVAAYSEGGVGPEVAVRAGRGAAAVRSEVAAAAGPLRRALWAVDPRPLWSSRGRLPTPDDDRRPLEPVG